MADGLLRFACGNVLDCLSSSVRSFSLVWQETKGVTVDLAEYKGGAVTVRVPLIEITDAQVCTYRKK